MTHLERFLTDENITVINRKGEIFINIESYNYDTLADKQKTKRYFERLKKYKKEILNKYSIESFVCSVMNFNIDGLYESNSLLLFEDSKLYSNY